MQIPILVTAFNRPVELRRCLSALASVENQVIVSLDGPRNNRDSELIQECLQVIKECLPSKTIVWSSTENRGCYRSVTDAISRVFCDYEALIVIEDDIVISEDFIPCVSHALVRFSSNKSIASICGMNLVPKEIIEKPEIFARLSVFSDSWGWATWKDRWEDFLHEETSENIDIGISTIKLKKSSQIVWKKILKSVYRGEIDSWAYRWMWTNWKEARLHLVFNANLASNIGFGNTATHTIEKFSDIDYSSISTPNLLDFERDPEHDMSADDWMERKVFKTNLASRLRFLAKRILSRFKRH